MIPSNIKNESFAKRGHMGALGGKGLSGENWGGGEMAIFYCSYLSDINVK